MITYDNENAGVPVVSVLCAHPTENFESSVPLEQTMIVHRARIPWLTYLEGCARVAASAVQKGAALSDRDSFG